MRQSFILSTLLLGTLTLLMSGCSNTTQPQDKQLSQVQGELSSVKDELRAIKQKSKQDELARKQEQEQLLKRNSKIHITVVGQGVAPTNTLSPAQAYALAKRAAIADGYRSLAEKLKGVRVEGQDTIRNMMIQKSTVNTQVEAMIKDANIVETVFTDGLCEVELEVILSYADFS